MQDRDETIERVRAALKPLPKADAHAVARVLSAVHGRTPQPTPRWRELLDWARMPSLSIAGAAGLAAIALFAGYAVKGKLGARGDSAVAATASATMPTTSGNAASTSAGGAPVLPAAAVDDVERAVPVQFVLDFPEAKTVSIVGDFNNWAIGEAPLQKFANGIWNISIAIKPGRHEYAFVVDGKQWIADPRAPKANNGDFGKPGSVIVVSTP